jgi:predicted tellurium resistance membrane protein TerC
MELPDLTNLTLVQLWTYLIAIAAVDVVFNVVIAILGGTFSSQYLLEYLRSHVVMRVFVIGTLGAVGHGIPAAGIPEIPAATLAATGSLALYVVETVGSLIAASQKFRAQPPEG